MNQLLTIYQIQTFAEQMFKGVGGNIPENMNFEIELGRKEFQDIIFKLAQFYNQPTPVHLSGLVLKYNCKGVQFQIKQSRNECHKTEMKEIKNGKNN